MYKLSQNVLNLGFYGKCVWLPYTENDSYGGKFCSNDDMPSIKTNSKRWLPFIIKWIRIAKSVKTFNSQSKKDLK